MRQLIADEIFVSIQELQAGFTKIAKDAEKRGKIVRVMRNNETLGVFVPDNIFLEFVKLFEGSPS
jgi:hypothetical protein